MIKLKLEGKRINFVLHPYFILFLHNNSLNKTTSRRKKQKLAQCNYANHILYKHGNTDTPKIGAISVSGTCHIKRDTDTSRYMWCIIVTTHTFQNTLGHAKVNVLCTLGHAKVSVASVSSCTYRVVLPATMYIQLIVRSLNMLKKGFTTEHGYS